MGKRSYAEKDEELYGILKKANVREVQFGLDKRFSTWYGSAAYFTHGTTLLGIKDVESTSRRPSSQPDMEKDYWLDVLYVCEFCFKYTDDATALQKHVPCCKYKAKPPGRIQYMSPEHTIRKVRGTMHLMFCQCMCLFTKLFLDNKSMYFKLDNYDFYIIYQTSTNKPMGFFSKDLLSYQRNNLACILTLPPYQRRGIGSILIDFSYKLSIREGQVSGPEKPLSPFGLVSYLKYWSSVICWQLLEGNLSGCGRISLTTISESTGIRIGDVILTLKSLKCLNDKDEISLSALRLWMKENSSYQKSLINDEYLVLDN